MPTLPRLEIFLASLAVIGTLMAALLAFLAPAWNQERIDRRRQAQELRAARRLVANELNLLAASLRAVGEGERQPSLDASVIFPTTAWETHRPVLASADQTSITEWRRLDTVYTRVVLLRQRLAGAIGETDRANFRETSLRAEYVRNMLLEDELRAAGLDPANAKIEWPTAEDDERPSDP